MNNDYTKYDTNGYHDSHCEGPTVIATAEDMDTELNLMDPQFWESMDFSTEANIF